MLITLDETPIYNACTLVVMLIISWLVFVYVMYLFTGLHVWIFDPINLQFRLVSYKNKKISIWLNKIKFKRFTWKGFSQLIFDGLVVDLCSPKTNEGKQKKLKKGSVRPLSEELFTTSIYSSKPITRTIQKLVISHLPKLSVTLRNFSINKNGAEVFKLNNTVAAISSERASHGQVRISLSLALHDIVSNQSSMDKLKTSIRFSVDLNTGRIYDFNIDVKVRAMSISVLNILQFVENIRDWKTTGKTDDNEQPQLEAKRSSLIQRKLQLLHNSISEATIHLDDCKLTHIPFMKPGDEISNYIKAERCRQFLEISLKSDTVNFSKLKNISPGFELLFNSDDEPSQFTASLLLLNLKYIEWDPKFELMKESQFLSLPSLSVFHKSNIFSKLLAGRGFDECTLEGFSSVSNPVIELTTEMMGLWMYNFFSFKRYLLSQYTGRSRKEENKAKHNSNLFHQKIVSLLSRTYPAIKLRALIEEPSIVLKYTDSDDCLRILNFKHSLVNFEVTTTKNRDYDVKVMFVETAICYLEKCRGNSPKLIPIESYIRESNIIEIDSITLNADILKEFQLRSSLNMSSSRINLSQLMVLNGIKEIYYSVTEKFFGDIRKVSDKIEVMHGKDEVNKKNSSGSDGIFRDLPRWLLSFQFKGDNITLTLGSRSIFIPSELVASLDAPVAHDFIHGDELRKIVFMIKSIEFNINNAGDVGPVSPFENKTKLTTPAYWLSNISISNITSKLILKTESSDKHFIFSADYDRFINIPSLNIELRANRSKKLTVDVSLDSLQLDYSVFKHFAILSMIHLINESIVIPFKSIMASTPQKSVEEGSSKSFVNVKLDVKKIELLLHLTSDFKVKLQAFNSRVLSNDKNSVSIGTNFVRLLADSPTVPSFYNRIVCIDSLQANITMKENLQIDISNETIKLLQPHGFIVYKLFDNLSITIKAMKHLIKILAGNASGTTVLPTLSRPFRLPSVFLSSKKLSFDMDDDPFESELNMIFQIGLSEQRERLEKLQEFEERVKVEEVNRVEGNFDQRPRHDFDERSSFEIVENLSDDNLERLNTLKKGFALSWIKRVSTYKSRLNEELIENKKFLYGFESKLPKNSNDDVVPYSKNAPLLSIILMDLKLNLTSTKFPLERLPEFLHKYGKGVPLDTLYSFAFPSYIDLGISELRMHVRDYPLPMLYVPKPPKNSVDFALRISGHLIIAEAFSDAPETLRNIYLPLIPGVSLSDPDKFYSITVQKTLTPIKLFSKMDIEFDSIFPTKFTWGQSYQPALQQILLNFDQLSKPPLDPSAKVGFWDKLRLIVHGTFSLTFKNNNQLHVVFKGANNPYGLLGDSSGFVLCFKNNISLSVNKNDDPKDFVTVLSDEVQWSIPNHLSEPLLVWCRETSKCLFLPSSKTSVTSLFAYYLRDKIDPSNKPNKSEDYFEKIVISFTGGVEFNLGFIFERNNQHGDRSIEFKHHYDINLSNPAFTEQGHDSYNEFRSDYIHMAISLKANNENSYNTVHLTPGVFKSFFNWYGLFSSNTSLPVRNGPLFGEKKQNVKFAQHLYTNKFQIIAKPLYLAHIYRDESVDFDDDFITSVGLKAKIKKCSVDLHLRKEPVVSVNEALNKNKNILKMKMNVGEVNLTEIDLRAADVVFEKSMYKMDYTQDDTKGSKYKIFDGDLTWFDINDYEEAFIPSLKTSKRTLRIHPILHCERFAYYRNTSTDPSTAKISGNEYSHECLLGSNDIFDSQEDLWNIRIKQLEYQIRNNKTKGIINKKLENRYQECLKKVDSIKKEKGITLYERNGHGIELGDNKYTNQFFLNAVLLKWNNENRNLILKYIHYVTLRKTLSNYLSYDAMKAVKDIIESHGTSDMDKSSDVVSAASTIKAKSSKRNHSFNSDVFSAKQKFDEFEESLKSVLSKQVTSEDFLIKAISPQIQLMADDTPDSVVLLASPNIECKIVSVLDNSTEDFSDSSKALEKRYGVVMRDCNIFVLDRDVLEKSSDLIYAENGYGSNSFWPPWLGLEICENGSLAGSDKLLIQKTSMAFKYSTIDRFNYNAFEITESTHNEHDLRDRMEIDVPEIVISCNSNQYFTLFSIIINLLIYAEPIAKKLQEKLHKVIFSIDFNNLNGIYSRLELLQKTYKVLGAIANNYKFRQSYLNNEDLNDFLMTNLERNNIVSEIFLLLKSVFTGNKDMKDTNDALEWSLTSDEIILHLLEDNMVPFIDFKIANGSFKRLITGSGSDLNKVEIGSIQGFNLMRNIMYPDLLQPMSDDIDSIKEKLVTVDWTMNRTVGGIKIIENFHIDLQPLDINLEQITGEKLMVFIFGSDGEIHKSPLLLGLNKDENDDCESDDSSEYIRDDDDDDANDSFNGKKYENVTFDDEDDDDDSDFVSVLDSSSLKDKPIFGLINPPELMVNGKNVVSNMERKTFSTNSTGSVQYKSITKLGESINDDDDDDNSEVDEMIDRAAKYYSIISLTVNPAVLRISFKGKKGLKKLLNVDKFIVRLPELHATDKIFSVLDLVLYFKSDIIKALLSHTGSLISNKMKINRLRTKKRMMKSLKSPKNNAKFTPISDPRKNESKSDGKTDQKQIYRVSKAITS